MEYGGSHESKEIRRNSVGILGNVEVLGNVLHPELVEEACVAMVEEAAPRFNIISVPIRTLFTLDPTLLVVHQVRCGTYVGM